MSFIILLVLFAFVLFVVTTLLLTWVGEAEYKACEKIKPRFVSFLLYIFVGVFFLLSIRSALIGVRTITWFYFFAFVGLLCLYFSGYSTVKSQITPIFIITVLAITQSLIPIVQNKGIIFGPDQWRDLEVTTYIVEKGTFEDYPWIAPGFYSFIPLFNIFNAVISKVLGCPPMLTIGTMQAFFCLISVLSVYIIMKKLYNNAVISLLAAILLISTPRLALIQSLPSTASLSLGLLLLLSFIKGSVDFSRGLIGIIVLLALVTAIIHPIGVLIALVAASSLLLFNYLHTKNLAVQAITFIRGALLVCLATSLACWVWRNEIFKSVFNPLLRFLRSFATLGKSSLYYPQYQSADFEIFSFAWALPVAFSAAFVLTTFIKSWRKKNETNFNLPLQIITASTIAGLGLILSAFLSVLISPGAAIERYVSTIGYALLILPTSIVFGRFLFSKKKIALLFAIILLSANIIIASRSPDLAPFENPTFGAVRYTFTGFTEANTIVNFLPNNTYLYEDHDIPLAGVGNLKGLTFITYRSYQPTRVVIQSFKDNSFKPFYSKYKNAFVAIKTDEIVDQKLFYNFVNIIYSSENHVMVNPL